MSRYLNGPQDLQGHPALVTDDTQMALAIGKALTEAKRPYTAITLEEPLRRAFVDWSKSPDNNRAPGMTCMSAGAKLASGMPWQQAPTQRAVKKDLQEDHPMNFQWVPSSE